jgi:hypothetical protein
MITKETYLKAKVDLSLKTIQDLTFKVIKQETLKDNKNLNKYMRYIKK